VNAVQNFSHVDGTNHGLLHRAHRHQHPKAHCGKCRTTVAARQHRRGAFCVSSPHFLVERSHMLRLVSRSRNGIRIALLLLARAYRTSSGALQDCGDDDRLDLIPGRREYVHGVAQLRIGRNRRRNINAPPVTDSFPGCVLLIGVHFVYSPTRLSTRRDRRSVWIGTSCRMGKSPLSVAFLPVQVALDDPPVCHEP